MDLPAMKPCKVSKSGRHHLSYVLPSSPKHDMTAICERCGALRRVPVSGSVYRERLDDLSAAEIERAVRK